MLVYGYPDATMVKIRDSVVSLIGVVSAQGVFFLCITLLGREYGPEMLGRFNADLAIGTLAGTLLALRYELACVSDKPEQSFNALVHVLALVLGVAMIGAVGALCSTHAALWSGGLYAVSLFIQNLTGLYLNSLRRYGLIALCKIVVNVGFAVYLIAPAGNSTHAAVFTIYALTSAAIAFAFLVCALVHGWKCGYSFRIGTRFYRDNNRYAKFILPSTLCASVLIYSLSIAIPAWYSADQAGYFAAAYRFGFFPVSLIGQGIGGVFRRDAIEATTSSHAKMSLEAVFKVYARGLLLIAVAYALFGALLFEPLVKNLLGQRWEGSANFFYLLLPMFAAQIIYVPLSQVFLATQRQRLDFFIQLASGSSLLVVLYGVHLASFTVMRSVFVFSIAGTACTLVGIFMTMRIADVSLFRRRFSAGVGDLNGSA